MSSSIDPEWQGRESILGDSTLSQAITRVLRAPQRTGATDAAGVESELAAEPIYLGAYRIIRLLGAGGMGAVFLAEDTHLGRRVAIKIMKAELDGEPTAKARFLVEARAMAALKHRHVVTIYHVAEADGVPYFAMEFLEGEALSGR